MKPFPLHYLPGRPHRVRALSGLIGVSLLASMLGTSASAQTAVSAAPVAHAAAADTGLPWSWADLQAWSAEQGPAVRLARLKEHVASSNLKLVESDNGARLVAAADLARAKEPVTDTLNRNYSRLSGQAGLRWSFLGAEEARRRNVQEARTEQLSSAAQTQLLQVQAVTELGRLYVRYLRSQQREQVAQAYLSTRSQIEGRLRERVAGGHMLRSEGLDLQGYYEAAQNRVAREKEVQRTALQQMSFLTGRRLRAQPVPALTMPQTCMNPAMLQDALNTHPALESARYAMEGVREQAQHTRYGGVTGGVQLSQSLSKDFGGSPGHATAVAVDVSIPLQWRDQKDAMAAKLQGKYDEAAEQYAQTQGKLQLEQQTVLEQYRLSQGELKSSAQRYAAATEGLRVAQLRAPSLDGDGMVQAIKAGNGRYEAAVRYISAAEEEDLAAMDMLYYTRGCSLQMRSDDPLAAVLQRTGAASTGGADGPVVAAQQARPGEEEGVVKPVAAVATVAPAGTGWYSWKGWQWVEQPARIDQLPQGTQRLLVSFTEEQLQRLTADEQARQGLEQLAQRARQRGIRLELLLGEPTWVLPKGRGNMLALLQKVQSMPFGMIHLDLERSQLPEAQQKDWGRNVLDSLQEAVTQSRLPISLTTHHRELREPGFLQALQKAGVKEVVPMIYSANAQSTVSAIRQLPPMPQGLDLAVAQSIEKELPSEESLFRMGRRQALVHWQGVAQSLRTVPGFKGIVVQSWEDYMEAQP
ncbi:MAG: TolC family protein [Comamonas sp.]|jgi:outer membrane protein TolC|uniref:TolC family protein n=1 Tax=Comamonas sp. TaxID=34028 RepID=UPI002823BA2C|nr:TolC family protein [Comamonas sp.]MDR0214286.1 TolC family protein [Comamonas sp.]